MAGAFSFGQNLTLRTSKRRFTRRTGAFSKKLENLQAAVASHFARYNLLCGLKSLRCPRIAWKGLPR
jgi:hypothetical protein